MTQDGAQAQPADERVQAALRAVVPGAHGRTLESFLPAESADDLMRLALSAALAVAPPPVVPAEPAAWRPKLKFMDSTMEVGRTWSNGTPRPEDVAYWDKHADGIEYAYAPVSALPTAVQMESAPVTMDDAIRQRDAARDEADALRSALDAALAAPPVAAPVVPAEAQEAARIVLMQLEGEFAREDVGLGYVKRVCEALLAATPVSAAPVPVLTAVPTQAVIDAVYAVDREAARRGEMFPQTSDEQRDDRRAVARVMGMLKWYEKNTGCANIKGWPALATKAAAPQEPT